MWKRMSNTAMYSVSNITTTQQQSNNSGRFEKFLFFIIGPQHEVIFAYRDTVNSRKDALLPNKDKVKLELWDEENSVPAGL